MDNDCARFLIFGMILATFLPQVITILSLTSEGRKISGDANCGDTAEWDGSACICLGLNQYWNGEKCVCDICYAMDSNGECIQCDRNCVEGKDQNGNMTCVEDENVNYTYEATAATNQIKEEDIFKTGSMYTAGGMHLKHAHFDRPHEHDPGPYPSFGDYKQVDMTTIEDVYLANAQAALNAKSMLPFLPTAKATRLPNRTSNMDIDRKEHHSTEPEKEHILHTGLNPRGASAEYATNSLGMSANYPEGQLTDWSNGDLMTGYKPISDLHRPFSMPEMVHKLPERSNHRLLSGQQPILAGPVQSAEFDVKKQNDVAGRESYPTTGNIAETALYWQSEIPHRDARGIEETEMWQVANPLYSVQADVPQRDTIFRNAREAHIPDTMGHGFYGNVLDPMKNVSNHTKTFYATNGWVDNDYDQLRNKQDGMTRNDDRLLPGVREPVGEYDVGFIRNMDEIRNTSNKVYDNTLDNHLQRISYGERFDLEMADRNASIGLQKRRISELPSYSTANVWNPQVDDMVNRSELIAIGPGNFSGY